MDKQEKIKYLKNFKKEDDIHSLLEELLPEMGYTDVKITHERGNAPEDGKDLICSKYDSTEDKKDWIGFVVKKGVIAGTSPKIKEVEAQTDDCFKYSYKSVTKGEVRINKVKVVTNERFSNAAESKILRNNNLNKANIDFWDGEKLVGYIDKYFSKYWLKGSKIYKKYIGRLEEQIKVDNISKTLGVNNKKLEYLIENAIQLKLVELVRKDDGSFDRKVYDSNSIVKIPDNSIITGEPGCGKTTLFKILTREVIEQNTIRNETEYYPILISFNDIYKANFDIEKALEEHFKKELFNDLEIEVKQLTDKQNFTLFIDSLDEIGKKDLKEKSLTAIKEFKQKFPDVRLYCASRPSDYLLQNCQSLGFRYLEVDPLNRRQIEQFVNTYFNSNSIKCKKLLRSLQDSGILNKLPKTPLTLSLISIIFDEQELEIPATISDLYGYFVDLLLGKSQIKDTVEIIEISIKQRLLSFLAKEMHSSIKQSLYREEAIKVITEYSKQRGQTYNPEDILDQLVGNTGLLFINEKKEVQFKHLSFQEYFTAYEYYHHRPNERNIFIENFNKVWWQNVAIFYAGMTKDAPQLINEILEKSSPKSFEEAVINCGGLGHLMQALYTTPISERVLGVSRSSESITYALNALITTEDTKYDFFKKFSKYALIAILSGWYRQTHASITLLEPIKQTIELLENKKTKNEQEGFDKDFKLFSLTSSIGNNQFLDFEKLFKFLNNRTSNDLSLIAAIDSFLDDEKKILTRDKTTPDNFNKMYTRNKLLVNSMTDLADRVNRPLKKFPKNKEIK